MRLTLLPEPRKLRFRPGRFHPRSEIAIGMDGAGNKDTLPEARRLQRSLKETAGIRAILTAGDAGDVRLKAGDRRIENPEGYSLTVSRDGVRVSAAGLSGIRHAVSTLIQIAEQARGGLPCLSIEDEPDFARRGVMLDISRDKVPRLATLTSLVDMLGSWKVNELQLYTEHTFAYRNHRQVWENASPLTGEDILALDAHCLKRGIELVPNQNSFGHLHRWLVHERYRPLAEAPRGVGWMKEPWSLNPIDARSVAFLRDLFDDLLPHFSSRQFNVGCDETWDLGKVRSRPVAERIGEGRLYLEFLLKIYREVKARGHVMQFWGDIILNHPNLVRLLPRDAIALVWGYEADHPFAKQCPQFRQAGIPFYVCPGTSSWMAITGRTANALENTFVSAEQGKKWGALGLLNTDWGDNGHWQYLPVSYLGFAAGASAAWNARAARRVDYRRALDFFAFHDEARVMGRLAYDLGNIHRLAGPRYFNGTAMNHAMMHQLEELPQYKGQRPAGFLRIMAGLKRIMAPVSRARMKRPDAALIRDEFVNAARLAAHGSKRGLLAFQKNAARAKKVKRELDRDLKAIMREHKRLWMARNRPGGLKDSVARMEKARQEYLS